MRLKDKTAIVTGASSGFGEGIARAFADEGGHVWYYPDCAGFFAEVFLYESKGDTRRDGYDKPVRNGIGHIT